MAANQSIDDEFIAFLDAMDGRMRRLACVYAAPGDRDDLIQEMQLQLWKSWARFRSDSSRATWAYRIVLNTALMHRRSERRRPVQNHSEPESIEGEGTYARQQVVLAEFMSRLRPVDRAVFVLFLENVERSEMVEILGLSASAIASRLNRIKTAFMRDYAETSK